MDDGSTDGMLESLPKDGWLHLRNEKNHGIGSAMKRVFQYALDNNYDVLVIQAGNDKDDPNEIPRLLEPISSGRADFVQARAFFRRRLWQYAHLSRVGNPFRPSVAVLNVCGKIRHGNHQWLSRLPHRNPAGPAYQLAARLAG